MIVAMAVVDMFVLSSFIWIQEELMIFEGLYLM